MKQPCGWTVAMLQELNAASGENLNIPFPPMDMESARGPAWGPNLFHKKFAKALCSHSHHLLTKVVQIDEELQKLFSVSRACWKCQVQMSRILANDALPPSRTMQIVFDFLATWCQCSKKHPTPACFARRRTSKTWTVLQKQSHAQCTWSYSAGKHCASGN